MSLIIDKRNLPKNQTSGSRQKFIDRYKKVIKQRIREMVQKGNIDTFNKGVKKVKIDRDDLDEPSFEFEQGTGNVDRIYIGNKDFKKGQKIGRSKKGQGNGGPKGGNGSGEDDEFEFVLTDKEFSDLFFEDLALPDMIKREFLGSCFEIKHAGYSSYGGPSSLNIKKTMLNALGRRIALDSRRKKFEKELDKTFPDRHKYSKESVEYVKHSMALEGQQVKKKKVQYIEDIDLKYNFKDKVDVPVTRAVMFCLMDVSGSMGELEKDIAKRFYILLNLFLKRNYDIVDVVFIRHAETANEVDEETFFHSRESGGTIISSGYEKVDEIIKARYNPEQWNIYVAQTSDGENWEEDMPHMEDVLIRSLLPVCQYFAYIDIASSQYRTLGSNSIVGDCMTRLSQSHKNLQATIVQFPSQIFNVFRALFKKKEK